MWGELVVCQGVLRAAKTKKSKIQIDEVKWIQIKQKYWYAIKKGTKISCLFWDPGT